MSGNGNATPDAKRAKRGQIPLNMREGVGASPNYSPAVSVDVTPGSPGDKAFGASMNPAQRGLLTPQELNEHLGAPGQLPDAAPEPPVAPDAPLKAPKPVPQTVVRSLGSAFNNAALEEQQKKINARTAAVRAGAQGGRRRGKKSHKKHGKKSHKKHRKTRRRVRFDRI